MSSRQFDFPAFGPKLAPMRAARQKLAKAKSLHSLESLASAWLPKETLLELASLPGKRLRKKKGVAARISLSGKRIWERAQTEFMSRNARGENADELQVE